MKKYVLKKDLPFAKKGEIYESRVLDDGEEYLFFGEIKVKDIDNFGEWFEEIKEPKRIYYANDFGCNVANMTENNNSIIRKSLKSVGNHFETYEEAKAYLEYLKAKTIIKQDAKGFKPDWNNEDEKKYYGFWDFEWNDPQWKIADTIKRADIYFKRWEDIDKSFNKHPEEWKTYLTYEQ